MSRGLAEECPVQRFSLWAMSLLRIGDTLSQQVPLCFSRDGTRRLARTKERREPRSLSTDSSPRVLRIQLDSSQTQILLCISVALQAPPMMAKSHLWLGAVATTT